MIKKVEIIDRCQFGEWLVISEQLGCEVLAYQLDKITPVICIEAYDKDYLQQGSTLAGCWLDEAEMAEMIAVARSLSRCS